MIAKATEGVKPWPSGTIAVSLAQLRVRIVTDPFLHV
jgi:hypothetical protein